MKRGIKIGLLIAIFIVVILGLALLFLMPSYMPTAPICVGLETLKELVDKSDIILVGTAGTSENVVIDRLKGQVETHIDIRVNEVIKGPNLGMIKVSSPGGKAENDTFVSYGSEAATFRSGEKSLLFLRGLNPRGAYTVPLCTGKVNIENINGDEAVPCFSRDIYDSTDCLSKEYKPYIQLDKLINKIRVIQSA